MMNRNFEISIGLTFMLAGLICFLIMFAIIEFVACPKVTGVVVALDSYMDNKENEHETIIVEYKVKGKIYTHDFERRNQNVGDKVRLRCNMEYPQNAYYLSMEDYLLYLMGILPLIFEVAGFLTAFGAYLDMKNYKKSLNNY